MRSLTAFFLPYGKIIKTKIDYNCKKKVTYFFYNLID